MMAIEDDIKQVEAFIKSGGQRLTFGGKTYTLTTARTLLKDLQARQQSEETTGEITASKLGSARDLVQQRQLAVDAEVRAFSRGRSSETKVRRAQLALQTAQEGLARLEGRPVPATGRAVIPQATIAEEERMRTEAFAGRPGPVTPQPTPTPGAAGVAAAAPKKVTSANVTAELTKRGLADTPENRAAVRADLEGKTAVVDWESLVAEQAGEYAYLLDPKYEGVPELLRKAVQQGWFKSDEGQKQFLQEFKATGYYRNTSQKQQLFDKKTPADKQVAVQAEIDKIRAEYGEIQLDQTALEEVATAAARNGASAIELGRLVYRAAFKRGAAQPAFGATVAAKTALRGEDADRIRGIYRAYGQKADDQTIARILAGEADPASGIVMTEDMLRNNLRDIAKVSYKPFADLLDRGISVETIFQPYQAIASRVLEKSPDQVSLLDENGVPTQFASALMSKEPMSLTDWMTTLKSDERYGWQFTSEAKQKATSLVMDLEKAFGFRA